jgi:ABC-type hemin transport system ATPase subunit
MRSLGDGIAGIADRYKQNKSERAEATKKLEAYGYAGDVAGMSLDDLKGELAKQELQVGMKTLKMEQRKHKAEMQAKRAQARQADALAQRYATDSRVAAENQQYTNHQRDLAAEAQAGEAAYLQRYAQDQFQQRHAGNARGDLSFANFQGAAPTQGRNPNADFAARYLRETGQVASPEVLQRYGPQRGAPETTFVRAPNGKLFAERGNMLLDASEKSTAVPREIALIEALEKRGYSPAEAEKQAKELLGRGDSPEMQLLMSILTGDGSQPATNGGATPAGGTGAPPLPQY